MDIEKLYRKFLSNELNEQELNFFSKWLHTEEADEFLKKKMNLPADFENHRYADWNSKELKKNFLEEIKASNQLAHSKKRRRWLSVVGLAASIALLLAFFVFNEPETVPEVLQTFQPMVNKANEPGKKTKIQLKDGSVVYLNSGSEITYPENFLVDRTVWLKGEAYFEVAGLLDNPFRVICDEVETKALGTSFNIKSYRPGSINIVLATGKVEVTSEKVGTLLLLPGEGLKNDNASKGLIRFNADVEKTLFWKSGTLQLEQLTMPETFEMLERWFGITISPEGKVPHSGRFSGTFPDNETLGNVLDVLQHSGNFSYSIEGKNVKISFNP